MRVRVALILFLSTLGLAWLAVCGPVGPLVDASGVAGGAWLLRQQLLYLSGLLAIGLMALALVLALRLPWLERPLGGMDQVYRLHKWAGVGAALAAVAHWAAKESSGWMTVLWSRAGKPVRDAVLPWLTGSRSLAKDVGEWAFYLLLAAIALTLLTRLLAYRPWRVLHRAMPVLFLALAFHSLALTPLAWWGQPAGLLMGALLALGSSAALWSLAGRVGQRRRHAARIHSLQVLGEGPGAPLEVVCAVAPSWPGHRAGQFAFVRFERSEGAHPFTIASAPASLGRDAQGDELLRLVIKPLGDYTRTLRGRLRAGQALDIEGPYGQFDGRGAAARQQVWVAAGVGITPFLALLEARQGDAAPAGAQPAQLHYCTRNATADPLLARLQALCAQAHPPVRLTVHDAARGQRLTPAALAATPGALDLWFCGPQGLGDALADQARRAPWRLHRESFAMR
ncbi:ferredoxin reductase family protein [Pulveribacter suum]|uniref:Ferric reductase n=1 Tax=Pulveribacter suum TaxID=2116657 RepID=A0A2P1NH43_9BURK|nr:ferric reductase-like transmembrane domain-containing protein [Pulveribacter suum]AVP56366.1 ferric reductase [Pulveribacter suum]